MQRPKEFLLPLEHLFMQPIYKNSGLPPTVVEAELRQRSRTTSVLLIDHHGPLETGPWLLCR